MLELGASALEMHRRIGMLLATIGVAAVFLQGDFAHVTAAGAREGGLTDEQVLYLSDDEAAVADLQRQLRRGDWILVKGSRRMKMDRLVAKICQDVGVEKAESNVMAP
jgi:UDP-N-acetylmuramoyl-tripeptide--D-alanyl-D-alanine ligase